MNDDKHYVYVMVRNDLSPEQRAVQACHASFELGLTEGEKNSTLILLSAKSEEFLLRSKDAISSYGIGVKLFYEPDMKNQATAWACSVYEHERNYFDTYNLLKYNRGIMWHFIKFCKAVWQEWNNE